MRKLVGLLAIACLSLATLPVAGAGPSLGGISSDNVEFIRHIPLSQDGVGGRLVGDYFYTNDQNKVMIFDLKNPEDPEMVGFLPMPQEWLTSREDLDGNDSLIVVPNDVTRHADGQLRSPCTDTSSATSCTGGALYIINVEDKTNPVIVGTLPGAASHTSSCVLDCKYVYNSNGQIIDIRNPSKPKLLDSKWGDGKIAQSGHDVEEVAPGIVVTASNPIMVLDARQNPAKPKLLAASPPLTDVSVMHSIRWANNAMDNLFVAGTEKIVKARCGAATDGHLMTLDASDWKKTRTLGPILDRNYATNGTYADGKPAANTSCSSHWLELHPTFRNGGLVSHSRFDHGVRIMDVSSKGKIEEIGYFLPWVGNSSASYWVTDRIIYSLDYNRGLDIIKYTGDI